MPLPPNYYTHFPMSSLLRLLLNIASAWLKCYIMVCYHAWRFIEEQVQAPTLGGEKVPQSSFF